MPDAPDDKSPSLAALPEEFAPTGPKLSRFRIQPAPPIRPHLFRDEARFVLQLSLLVFGTEFAAWAVLSRLLAGGVAGGVGFALAFAALRWLRPFWARAGTRISRPILALVLLAVPLLLACAALFVSFVARTQSVRGPHAEAHVFELAILAGFCAFLPALGDLAASCAADAITVERRSTAFSWLSMAQSLGLLLGLAIGASAKLLVASAALGLLLALCGVPALRDRKTPRSAWPLALYAQVFRTPLARELCALAVAVGGFAGLALPRIGGLNWLAPILGMIFAARVEPRTPNAVLLPRLLAGLALVAALLAAATQAPFAPALPPGLLARASGQLALFALGAAASALPAAVARAAGEMERPIVASLVWTALFLGVATALATRAVLG